MKAKKLTDNIYWVGGIDWDLDNFHGYLTPRGSTYNAYLIIDEKVTLIDTVKHYLYDEMIARISDVIDPQKIDYIVSNHVEMDHSGGLPKLMKASKAQLFTSPKGKEGLEAHYDTDQWNIETIKAGEPLNIGERNLEFILTPMVHWPDNMLTYLPQEKILFSNDAFGQHIASSERFDDMLPLDIILEEAKRYYANIVMGYSSQVKRVLDNVAKMDLAIEMIAPSHGIIWRSNIGAILKNYTSWSKNETKNRALIVYDTMWGSTKKIAYALQGMFESLDIEVSVKNLDTHHISDVITEVLEAKYICVGSPTLNNNMLPTVASFLTYLKGLSPENKKGIAFGSYGWSGQSVGQVADVLDDTGYEVIDRVKMKYIPGKESLSNKINKLKEEI